MFLFIICTLKDCSYLYLHQFLYAVFKEQKQVFQIFDLVHSLSQALRLTFIRKIIIGLSKLNREFGF